MNCVSVFLATRSCISQEEGMQFFCHVHRCVFGCVYMQRDTKAAQIPFDKNLLVSKIHIEAYKLHFFFQCLF